jgi:CRP-like cAMP-binding protein
MSGSVGVSILTAEQKQIEVNVLHAGASFGELALLKGKNGRRAATVVCKERCSLAYFTKDIFNKLISK